MADNRKYYYLKLKEDFFDTDEMKILESMKDGYLYSNILLKLYLKSLSNSGRLMYRNVIPYTPEILATLTGHQVGTVEKALDVFKKLDLIEMLDNGAIYMMDIQNFIGQSSSEADRQREYYNRMKAENGDKRGKFGMLAKKWQYLTDTERMPADISEYCCEALKKEPFKRYVKETGRQPFIGITQDESFRRENQYNHTGCNVYDGHTIKSQPMGFWPKNEVIQYAVEQRIPICSVYGTPYQDKKGNWYFTGEQRTGCCVCGFGCHLEPVPNRLQRLRTSDNDKHRRMCEGCLQIKNHGMTYEQALNYAGIPTEEVQEDE